jgi:hypothetical protein
MKVRGFNPTKEHEKTIEEKAFGQTLPRTGALVPFYEGDTPPILLKCLLLL